MLETEIVLVPKHYVTHHHRFTVNAQFVTLISGLPMNKLSPRSGIVRLVKKGGKTNHIERFNLTLRQRVSRLPRKILSFL